MTRQEALEAVAEAARKWLYVCADAVLSDNARQQLDDALAALDAAPNDDGWRPIDYQVKNGEEWLLGSQNGIAVCFYSDDGLWLTADGIGYQPGFFTHYRPLPPPPKEKT